VKLYRADVFGPDGSMLRWHTSKREAEREQARWIREEGDAAGLQAGAVRAVEIPTDRAGLVDWLNRHFNTDNG
jgi:hypothetical protein